MGVDVAQAESIQQGRAELAPPVIAKTIMNGVIMKTAPKRTGDAVEAHLRAAPRAQARCDLEIRWGAGDSCSLTTVIIWHTHVGHRLPGDYAGPRHGV